MFYRSCCLLAYVVLLLHGYPHADGFILDEGFDATDMFYVETENSMEDRVAGHMPQDSMTEKEQLCREDYKDERLKRCILEMQEKGWYYDESPRD